MTCFSRIPTIHILKALSGLFSEVCLLSLSLLNLYRYVKMSAGFPISFTILLIDWKEHGIGTDCGNLQSFYNRPVNQ